MSHTESAAPVGDTGRRHRAADDPRRIQTLLILGASGDLTGRLLLPGIARPVARGRASGLTVVGAGVEDWASQWDERVRQVVGEVDTDEEGQQRLDAMASTTRPTSPTPSS